MYRFTEKSKIQKIRQIFSSIEIEIKIVISVDLFKSVDGQEIHIDMSSLLSVKPLSLIFTVLQDCQFAALRNKICTFHFLYILMNFGTKSHQFWRTLNLYLIETH